MDVVGDVAKSRNVHTVHEVVDTFAAEAVVDNNDVPAGRVAVDVRAWAVVERDCGGNGGVGFRKRGEKERRLIQRISSPISLSKKQYLALQCY